MCICRTKEARKCSRPFGYLKIQIHEEIAQFWFLLICLIFRIKIELHFSLIAAAVLYIMWKNVGQEKIHRIEGKSMKEDPNPMDSKKRRGTEKNYSQFLYQFWKFFFVSGYWRVDCQSASKGLFLGLLCLVGGIIILIIFFVMKVSITFGLRIILEKNI